jgi:hypothetical protein
LQEVKPATEAGFTFLARPAAPRDNRQTFIAASHREPILPVMDGSDALLITAPGCHLCAHAREVLTSLDLDAREVDVASPEAQGLADAGIPLVLLPVLWDGEQVLAHGRFSERALRRRLAG